MEQMLERLQGQVGTEIGVTDWMEITQDRVNAFADATDDHQFIHVDPERASRTPFGGTTDIVVDRAYVFCCRA